MPRARHFFPESAILIVLGLFAGFCIYEAWTVDLFLHPDLFFLYLLPPIVLEAGYFMPNKAFVSNIGTITLFAVAGTVFNIFLTSCFIFAFQNFYDFQITVVDTLLFSTVISAVDPVAVLSVFEEIHVNKLLYITVFGESLLNDAVTVVLYHSFHSMVRIGQAHLIYQDYTMSMMNFFLVSGGGILVGVVFAVVAALGVNSHGLGPLHRIRGNMDRFVYEQILQNVMLPFARASLKVRYSFQQDNDSKHTSNHIKTAWAQIPQSVLTNLPRRCQAVIDSRGFAD
uniref:Na_H_Exchanger domain-containing protein n=1 Tax=Caenorhabditis japonica TaxID=281687 RepID=A0A8R1EK00_CAEJA